MRSLPAIARLDYLDVVLAVLGKSGDGATVDDIRIAIGQSIEELALRGEARLTRDWRHPFAYRDTTVDSVRELMRWHLVEAVSLADTADAFERIRQLRIRLNSGWSSCRERQRGRAPGIVWAAHPGELPDVS